MTGEPVKWASSPDPRAEELSKDVNIRASSLPCGPRFAKTVRAAKISPDIGFLLRSRPALDPPLSGDRISDPLVMLGENELYGAARERIAVGNQFWVARV